MNPSSPISSLLFALLLALAFSGCIREGAPGRADGKPVSSLPEADDEARLPGRADGKPVSSPEGLPTFTLDYRSLDAKASGARAVLEVLSDGDLNITTQNGRGQAGVTGVWEGCGTANFTILRNEETVASDETSWGESRGHAIILGTGGQPRVVTNDLAIENYFLGVDFNRSITVPAKRGDLLMLTLGLRDGNRSAFHASMQAGSQDARLQVLAVEPFAYKCGTNLGEFSGRIVSSGLPPALLTVASDATLFHKTNSSTVASLTVLFYPLLGGTCQIGIEWNGQRVNDSGLRSGACDVEFTGPPGDVTLEVETLQGYSPFIFYRVEDKPTE